MISVTKMESSIQRPLRIDPVVDEEAAKGHRDIHLLADRRLFGTRTTTRKTMHAGSARWMDGADDDRCKRSLSRGSSPDEKSKKTKSHFFEIFLVDYFAKTQASFFGSC